MHPDITAKKTGFKTEDMYNNVIVPTPISEEEKPSLYAERALRARKNAGLDTDNQAWGVTKKQDEVIVINNDDNNVFPGVFVKENPIDLVSVSREDFFWARYR